MKGRIIRLLILVSLVVLFELPLALASASTLGSGQESFASLAPVETQKETESELVFPDYRQRSQIISAYEAQVRQSPDSFLLLRLLAAQYLRRFREVMDVEDLLRAEQAARRSLAIQSSQNGAASMILASTLLSQHRFQEALQVATAAQQSAPDDVDFAALRASIQMELGDYEAAQQFLQTLPQDLQNSGHAAITARYLELTGHLDEAQRLFDSALQEVDAFYTTPAETRAWFHVRAGDLAFVAGDLDWAEQSYREALALFPQAMGAFTGLARLYAVQHRWWETLEIANQGIERVPLVETLGYKADAQRALGNLKGAAETEELINVVAHLSKVNGIYDRALAIYYIEHGIHLPEALEIAQREVTVRDDIYAEDTLAWAAAANGQWQLAEQAAQRAARYDTEDALLYFHQGMIALNCGNRQDAVEWLTQAIYLNPQFHPKYAAIARQALAELESAA
ncbi:MAG: tetratricopeptide repeat protein [Microcoleaceae cyanobacterium]